MKTEIDSAYQKEITCPYCGYVYRDSLEMTSGGDEEDVECECDKCEKEFRVTTHVTILYSSFKLPIT